MKSIRAHLVLWVIGALACALGVVLALTYVSVRKDVGRLFDLELSTVAQTVHLREDWVEAGRLRIARPGFFFAIRAYDGSGRVYFETRLPEIPGDAPQTFKQGYASVDTEAGTWRIYTYVTPEGNVQVGQPLAARDALARNLSLRAVAPMLLLIPLLAGLVTWALHRGLVPLRETSRWVRSRDASCLDPLPVDNVPRELLPLVEQINALLARLSSTFDGQRQFLADVAHELRSPVAALALQAQLAERSHAGAARGAAFDELRQGIERAGRLVQQLLDFARLEPGVYARETETVELAGLVRDVVGGHAIRAEALGIDLGADAPPSVKVTGGEPELRSMIANLVDNALRYAPRSSPVTVSLCRQDSVAELRVADRGPGIPAIERGRVFERYHRVPGDLTPGSGLGLPIVKAIVERHRGTLSLADANPGSRPPGLEVRIVLPLAQESGAGARG